jgi:hypothetical protein
MEMKDVSSSGLFTAKNNGPGTFKAVDWVRFWAGPDTAKRKISALEINQTPENVVQSFIFDYIKVPLFQHFDSFRT